MEDDVSVRAKVEFYHKELLSMVSSIPKKYYQRISNELIKQLASCLSNEINFEIVKGLMELQHVFEKYLYHLRLKIVSNQQNELAEAMKSAPLGEHQAICTKLLSKHKKQLRHVDKKLVQQLDSKVSEQQETLQKAGFPGFYQTTNTTEVTVQMFLLDFIVRLSKKEISS